MNRKIGFIGCGNMASAIIGGIINKNLVDRKKIIGSAKSQETLDSIEEKYKILTSLDNKEVARTSDIIFLAVKPYLYDRVIEEIKEEIDENKILVIIAAGKTIDYLEKKFDKKVKVVRTMPNTPAMVGEGMTAITFNKEMEEIDKEDILTIFKSLGGIEVVEEDLYHGVTAISGSSPAYAYMFIEALGDAGVMEGIPRDKAYKMVAQTLMGAAKMVLESGKHPGELKDMVCSPGGTTIEAVGKLEETGFRNSVISAGRTCAKKSREMTK